MILRGAIMCGEDELKGKLEKLVLELSYALNRLDNHLNGLDYDLDGNRTELGEDLEEANDLMYKLLKEFEN